MLFRSPRPQKIDLLRAGPDPGWMLACVVSIQDKDLQAVSSFENKINFGGAGRAGLVDAHMEPFALEHQRCQANMAHVR